MNITLYTFAKADNSTAVPSESGTTITGVIKSPSSIQNPIVAFDFGTENAPAFNYAFIDAYGRYYQITNWTWNDRLWFAQMVVDVLATYKTAIGSSTQYVVRSASACDPDIFDYMYPVKSGANVIYSDGSLDWSPSFENGSFIVGIINGDSSARGAVSYYAFTVSGFRAFCNTMLSNVNWLNIDFDSEAISADLLKSLFNPFQYIVSCFWFPFSITSGTVISSIKFGWWELEVSGCLRTIAMGAGFVVNISVPKNPNATALTKYLNSSPFTRYNLFLNAWGTIPIDSAVLYNQSEISVLLYIDFTTGIGKCHIRDGNSNVFKILDAQIGVPMAVAQIVSDYLGTAQNLVGGAVGALGNAFTGNVGNALISAVSGISSAIDSQLPQVSVSGSNGSISAFNAPLCRLEAEYMTQTENDPARQGYPLCKKVTISSLSGFIQCGNAHIDTVATATAEEQTTIENYMNSGFFYE